MLTFLDFPAETLQVPYKDILILGLKIFQIKNIPSLCEKHSFLKLCNVFGFLTFYCNNLLFILYCHTGSSCNYKLTNGGMRALNWGGPAPGGICVRGGPPKGGGVTPTPGRVLVAVVLCPVVPGPPRPIPTPWAAHGTKLFRPPTGSAPSDKYKNQTFYPDTADHQNIWYFSKQSLFTLIIKQKHLNTPCIKLRITHY